MQNKNSGFTNTTFLFVILPLIFFQSACENTNGFKAVTLAADDSFKNEGQSTTTTIPKIVTTTTTLPSGNPPVGFCNKLDFRGTTFPESVTKANQTGVFSLALDISGSFEGNDGWANLTNNFDGQGLSMGLLNQTLGTGSLQPLLKSMRELYPTQWRASFASSNRRIAVEDMLDVYYDPILASQSFNATSRTDFPDSEFSEDSGDGISTFATTGSTSESVRWAVRNLYDSARKFKPEWRTDLTKLITSAGYRSIQINAAAKIHSSVLKDSNYKEVGVSQLRAYLMIFDLLVQNGSIWKNPPSSNGAPFKNMLTEYRNYKKNNPFAPPQVLLETVVNLRLWAVRPEYVSDVKSRKFAIINGSGRVHGENRNLQKEYCYTGNVAF